MNTHVRPHKKPEVFQNKTRSVDETYCKSPWTSSRIMRSLPEKYFRSFTELRKDLPLSAAGCSGELKEGNLLSPRKAREQAAHLATAYTLQLSESGSEGTSCQENATGLSCLPA